MGAPNTNRIVTCGQDRNAYVWTRKDDSTVLDIAWHPENVLLATASSDTNCRVFSTFIKGVDKRPTSTPFGTKLPFGSLQGTYESSGWAHSCDWSPSGNQLAFVGHDSTMTVIDLNNGAPGDQAQELHHVLAVCS